MPKLKGLSGKEVIKILSSLGFNVASQKGSHVKLRRVLPDNSKQTLTVPDHSELDTGTLRAIYRQSLRYIPDEDLRPHFYSE